jgi:hypothetical protein
MPNNKSARLVWITLDVLTVMRQASGQNLLITVRVLDGAENKKEKRMT